MIVWGGGDGSNRFTDLRRYNPATNSWAAGTSNDAPTGRSYHSAVWTGEEMIVWGGFGNEGFLNIGGRYNVNNNRWTAITSYSAPAARWAHTAVWTGTEMIVWGGEGYSGYLNDTWILTPVRTMVLYQKP
jgi:N-acetylneuraminic acid mutarotase